LLAIYDPHSGGHDRQFVQYFAAIHTPPSGIDTPELAVTPVIFPRERDHVYVRATMSV
jgi:hypothetical protein